jgi:transposase
VGTIIKKKIKKYHYYYFVESKRIDGKPRIVNQVYLGTADSIKDRLEALDSKKKPLYSIVVDFADVALLFDIAARLGIVDIIDKYAAKRKQGASVGTYTLVAAINRAVAPTSKSCIADWFKNTILSRILPVTEAALTPQNYWNHMKLSDEMISSMDEEIVHRIINKYQIDTAKLIYDATNFYTYIDTKNPCELAKRGHNKEKRNDLKIVGLSMMITPDCNIPLIYDTYPGNKPDSRQFTDMVKKLKTRFERLTNRTSDVTVVFDRGNNSEDNICLLEDGRFPFEYVGGLKRNQCVELYTIDKSEYSPLEGELLQGCSAVRTTRTVWGRRMTVIVVFNPNLYEGQMQGVASNIEKTINKLNELQNRLIARAEGRITKGRAPTSLSIEKQVKSYLSPEYMSEIFSYEMTTMNAVPFFTYKFHEESLQSIQETVLGKTVLFTSRHDWSSEEIVASYRSAWHVEHAFRQMKDKDHLSVRPLHHWTDQKIKVHMFYCVLAYRLCCILMKELSQEKPDGYNHSLNKVLDHLSKIKYVTTILGVEKTDVLTSFTKGSELAEFITLTYDLKTKYLPVNSVR